MSINPNEVFIFGNTTDYLTFVVCFVLPVVLTVALLFFALGYCCGKNRSRSKNKQP